MAAHQAPLSLGFSRQEHWSGLPFPSPMHESEKWKWSCSVVSDFATPWTAAYQAPPSMGFSRQKYWSGVPLPSLKCSLGISNFLEDISSLSHSIVFLYFFVLITEEGCLMSLVMISVQEFLPHSHVSNTAPHPDLRLRHSWRCVTLAEKLIEVPQEDVHCQMTASCL